MYKSLLALFLTLLVAVSVCAQVGIQPKKELVIVDENFDIQLDPGEKVLSLPAQFFNPETKLRWVARNATDRATLELRAALLLPHGSQITRISMIYQDENGFSDIHLGLWETPVVDSKTGFNKMNLEVLKLSSSGETNLWKINTRRPDRPIRVNHLKKGYFLQVALKSSMRLNNVRVFYK